jgi:hypothetical protein
VRALTKRVCALRTSDRTVHGRWRQASSRCPLEVNASDRMADSNGSLWRDFCCVHSKWSLLILDVSVDPVVAHRQHHHFDASRTQARDAGAWLSGPVFEPGSNVNAVLFIDITLDMGLALNPQPVREPTARVSRRIPGTPQPRPPTCAAIRPRWLENCRQASPSRRRSGSPGLPGYRPRPAPPATA